MGHLQNNKPDPASQDHHVPLTYCIIACEPVETSLSISRTIDLQIGDLDSVDAGTKWETFHLVRVLDLLLSSSDVLLVLVEHSSGIEDAFRFRDPKTGIEV